MGECGGKDMWRRTEGCLDPSGAAREPAGDLACGVAPGIYASGYCECTDKIPRHFTCGHTKEPCRDVCAKPPPPSKLEAAFSASAAPAPASPKASSWWQKHMPTVVVSGLVLFLLVVHQLTIPAKDERKKFARLVEAQRREIAFERSFKN